VKIIQKLQRALLPFFSITTEVNAQSGKFVDLAPTSQADEKGAYFEALNFATNNAAVFNIALTGPYGSGKSSVIKSFLRRYSRPYLQISLASFVSDSDSSNFSTLSDDRTSNVNNQEIEISILQQMLYGADANSLPLSRFKRIQSPKWWASAVSLLIIFGCMSVWYLLQHKTEIASGEFFQPLDWSNWVNLNVFAFGFLFLWLILHRIYLQSFGLSLKGISLKDIEIAPENAGEESILSRHLDEIIYFFQSTSYDLVIIEDLDRFDNPEIFVTLREINGLINSNKGVKRHVRFLYALRDDMFDNTDRTKFFEFIVPIVPIINHSNSIDKILEQGKRLSLVERLDPQFLREVSRYLNDLRLIHNIFNEYAIYVDNLERDDEGVLNANKLLALLIYKNVLPSDFEALHQQKGALASLLQRYEEFIEITETDIKGQISEIEAEIGEANKQLPKDLGELQKIYAMAVIEKLPPGHGHIRVSNNEFVVGQLASREDLEQIMASDKIVTSQNPNGGWQQSRLPDIEKEVDESKTFVERKAEIEKKSAKYVAKSGQTVRDLKSDISVLRIRKFAEVIRANSTLAEACFKDLGDNKELMKFLVFEGHLDDTYYQYTSLFHKGRLSPYDNKFLIQIRSFNTPDPDVQIDNPAEVIVAMREADFRQSYVLNCHIVDCLFDNQAKYAEQISSTLAYISTNFDDCRQFFNSYYERGRNVQAFVASLASQWSEFPAIAAESEQNVSHISRLVAYAPEQMLTEAPYAEGPVSAVFSTSTREVLSEGVEIELSRLSQLNIEVFNLPSLADFPKEIEFIMDGGLYQVNIPNIQFIFESMHSTIEISLLEKSHYTTILASNNTTLKTRVEADFIRYVRRVLLKLESNTSEDESAILAALQHDEVATEYLEEYWERQTAILSSLAEIPHYFHPYAFEKKRIDPSWDNCLRFLNSESFSSEHLTNYLQDDDIRKLLLAIDIPDSKEALQIREFLLNNGNFDDDTYRSYISKLSKQFKNFPTDLSHDKLKILIEEKKILFSVQNFIFLGDQLDLKLQFVAQNIDVFLSASSDFEIDDNFRAGLLSSEISDDQKRTIVKDMDPVSITADGTRASVVGPILDRTSFETDGFGFDFLRSVIVNSSPASVQVSLLNKSQEALNVEQVRSILEGLPEPYSEIANFGKSPKIENTADHRSLAEWLEKRQIISSWKPTFSEKDIQIHTFRKAKEKPE
jgi:hypothetical protein